MSNPASAPAPCLSVVMPAFNEERTIESCLRAVLLQPLVLEVIVVDDCSADGTLSVVRKFAESEPRVRVVACPKNRGKGAALREGFAVCTGEVVIVQDADLEYDPDDYPKLLDPILKGHADAVLGSRFLGGGPRRVLFFWHCMGNKFLTFLSNCMTGLNLSDMETGYKAMRLAVLRRLRLTENRFGIEPEIMAKLAHLRVPIYEVPVSYYGRTYAEGKKIGWKDGVRAIWCIIKYAFARS